MIKIIFSRKGLDSTAGGIPSPKKGKNIQSFPIPYKTNTLTSYEYLGFGKEISSAHIVLLLSSVLQADASAHKLWIKYRTLGAGHSA